MIKLGVRRLTHSTGVVVLRCPECKEPLTLPSGEFKAADPRDFGIEGICLGCFVRWDVAVTFTRPGGV